MARIWEHMLQTQNSVACVIPFAGRVLAGSGRYASRSLSQLAQSAHPPWIELSSESVSRCSTYSRGAVMLGRRCLRNRFQILNLLPLPRTQSARISVISQASPGKVEAEGSVAISREDREILVQHLLVKEDQLPLLVEIQRRITQEGLDLSDLAAEYSICPSKDEGGMLGWLAMGQTDPAFEEAAFGAPVNKLVKVKTKYGWHLLQVLGERQAMKLEQIQVEEFHERMQDPSFLEEAQLIDVRELDQISIASIKGFEAYPLSGFGNWAPNIADDLDREKDNYLLCHHGMRSMQTAQWLQTQESSFNPSAVPGTSALLVYGQDECADVPNKREFDIDRGKIFVGNLPKNLQKCDIVGFFRSFGPIRDLILLRDHRDHEKNAGYCFIFFGGTEPHSSALKASEMDGAKFHGRTLRVKLDDGRWEKARKEERSAWTQGIETKDTRSAWHQERDHQSQRFREILTSTTASGVSVQAAFNKIGKHKYLPLFMCIQGYWFNKAKLCGVAGNSVIYNSIIEAHCKVGDMDKARELWSEMQEQGMVSSLQVFNVLMDGYCRIGDEENCLAVLNRIEEAGYEPTIVSYGCIINLYVKLGKMAEAVDMSKRMEAQGILHNKMTYAMLMNGYVRTGDCAGAFATFQSMYEKGIKPDVVVFNALVSAFSKNNEMPRALQTLQRMEQEGLNPSAQTYSIIIDGYARHGDVEMALKTVQTMMKAGCRPTAATYNAILHGFVHEGQIDKAAAILEDMNNAGVSPNQRSYTILIEGYAKLGVIGTAFEYFKSIKNGGFIIDVFAYSSLLKACCKSGRMQTAFAVLQEMKAVGIESNTYIYNILLDGWAQRGDLWEAADLMQQMQHNGTSPDVHTYTSFVNACCKAGDMVKATETFREMKRMGLQPNLRTYTTPIHGWSSAAYPEKALACFEEMKEQGVKPDEAVYQCLMTSLLSRAAVARDTVFKGIMTISSEMIASGYFVDPSTARYWQSFVRNAEKTPGPLTEAVQMTFHKP
ncbi:hypothetical protein R1flu_017468 [Riccia fluitans]|uniref:Peptidylprolyl isomerase n=1 Tax=Riccia fluitans TaxID=41844 RepID=A0ABD1ZEC2_9MARC